MTDPVPAKVACQLYLISPLDVTGDFPARLENALVAGKGLVTAFQFRVKGLDQHAAAELAIPLQAVCAAHDTAFIVNDDVALARRLKADGVHLGQGDGDPRDAREELGADIQIGVTCHASKHLAMEAGEAGADYIAFGPFFESTTKKMVQTGGTDGGTGGGEDVAAERPTTGMIEFWAGLFEIPLVAIGGITPDNCAPLIEAGADFIAVSGAVWNGDETAAIEAFAKVMR